MKPFTTIAFVLLALIALLQLARVLLGWEVTIHGFVVPAAIPAANAERIGELAIQLRIPSITANKALMERGLLMRALSLI